MDETIRRKIFDWFHHNEVAPEDVDNVTKWSKRLARHFDRSWQTLKLYVRNYRDSDQEDAPSGADEEPKDPRFEQAQDPEDANPYDVDVEQDDDRAPLILVHSKHNPTYKAVMDFERREYVFDLYDEPVFDVPFEHVQQWIEWYVYKGAGMTQAEVARESARQLDRPLTEAYFQMCLKALAINKKSTPFAPHAFYDRSPEQLVQGWREQDEALVEQKYRAKQVRYLKRQNEKMTHRLNTYDDFMAGVIAEADLEPVEVPRHPLELPEGSEAEEYTPGLVLGDWHIGKCCDLIENTFNVEVARQRVELWCDKVRQHFEVYQRPMDRCVMFFLGDQIDGPAGDMHHLQWMRQDVHSKEQCLVAADLMARAVEYVANLLPVPLEVYCVSGNHGRTRKNREDDPVRLAEGLTYEIAKARAPDADWTIFDGEIGQVQIRNTVVFLTHGSKTPKDLRKLGWAVTGGNVLVISGHQHKDQRDGFSDKHVMSIVNGSLCGIDDFERDQLAKAYRPSQAMVEIYDDGPNYGRLLFLD